MSYTSQKKGWYPGCNLEAGNYFSPTETPTDISMVTQLHWSDALWSYTYIISLVRDHFYTDILKDVWSDSNLSWLNLYFSCSPSLREAANHIHLGFFLTLASAPLSEEYCTSNYGDHNQLNVVILALKNISFIYSSCARTIKRVLRCRRRAFI